MEDLFRFILGRPAQRTDTEKSTIPAQPSGELHKALTNAKDSREPLTAVRRVAIAYAESPNALHSLGDLKHGIALQALIDALGTGADKSLDDLAALIKEKFNATAAEVTKDSSFQQDRERLSDALITNV